MRGGVTSSRGNNPNLAIHRQKFDKKSDKVDVVTKLKVNKT